MKRENEYSLLLMDAVPRSVAQALALSLAIRLSGSESFDDAVRLLAREWTALYASGVVSQKPAFAKLDAIAGRVEKAVRA